MSQRVLITGGTGLVGSALTKELLGRGYEVCYLSRKAGVTKEGITCYAWDYTHDYIDETCIDGVDFIIHLAGAGVADKGWTKKRKLEILDSRVKTSLLLRDLLRRREHKVKKVISASAVGFYGIQRNEVLDENSEGAHDFLATVTRSWEASVDQIADEGVAVCKLRIGIVLSLKGGALPKMLLPIKWGVGSALGHGEQLTPWVHIDDVVRMFIACFDDKFRGVYNVTAGNAVTNIELTKSIATQVNRPLFMPKVPKFALQILFGEMAEVVLSSLNVQPKRFMESGVSPKYSRLDDALRNLISND